MKNKSTVYFVTAVPERMDRDLTLPAKFQRLLEQLPLAKRVRGKVVAIKMHLGGGLGYTTIHPLFVKLLVDHIRKAKPADVFITDGSIKGASDRGYTRETVGARLIPAFGRNEKSVVERTTGWKHLEKVILSKPIIKADVLVNFSHVKGHGDCGFGGACKNLGMGCVPGKTRGGIHALEGDLKWDKAKCVHCNKCIEECATKANKFDSKGEYKIFWHHCKMCRHCMMICPKGAITITKRDFDLFQEALARVSKMVIDCFQPGNVFHINLLTNVTLFCDCWGMTTPSLVPDIGAFAGDDIVAVDDASLRAIKVENLIPGSITPPFELGKGGHLFERLHSRDPFAQVRSLEALGAGSSDYKVVEIK